MNIKRKLTKIFPNIMYRYNNLIQRLFKLYPHNGIKVMEYEWDVLIILDACRYDTFRELNTINGELFLVKTAETNTRGWVKANFGKYEKEKDTIYISGNPVISNHMIKKVIGYNPFYYIEDVWKYNWDSEIRTIYPRDMTKIAKEIISKSNFSDKRFIIHYIQPHQPFIKDPELCKTPEKGDVKKLPYINNVYRLMRDGKVSEKRVIRAYKNNLESVLKEVAELANFLTEKKLVITSDHGECHGEWGIYGHPSGVYINSLTEVPWLEINNKK